MPETLSRLCSERHEDAFARRGELASLALESSGFSDPAAYLADLASRTRVLTLLAGAGSRWVRSIEEAREVALSRGETPGSALDPGRPRGLYPVKNLLGGEPARLPVAAYTIAATAGLGGRAIVVRGFEQAIEAEIMGTLGPAAGARAYATQQAVAGKPRGHGDAAFQARELWKGADYVIANFGGDAASPATAAVSLMVLDALVRSGAEVDFLLPVARFETPSYPVVMDSLGLPRGFGHAKLSGRSGESGPGYANVGVRLYRASALEAALSSLAAAHFESAYGYRIPGNDPEGREMALDNADALFAERGRARVLAMATPDELTPVKSLEDVPAFEAAMERVLADSKTLGFPGPRLGA